MESLLSQLASRCKQCLAAGGGAADIRSLVEGTMLDLANAEHQETIDQIAHRSDDLLVVGLALPPYGNTPVHSHGGLWCVVGIAVGTEDNVLYTQSPDGLNEIGRFRIAAGEAKVLDEDVIHKIRNPDAKRSIGVHVYGGDLLSATRHMWNPHTQERSLLVQPQFDNWCDELTATAAESEQTRARG